MRRMPALTRFDNVKSISRYSPPNGTAGLARSAVSGASRLPAPPASTMASTLESAAISHLRGPACPVAALRTSLARQTRRRVIRAGLGRPGDPDLRLLVSGLCPVGQAGGLEAVPGGQVEQGLGAIVEILAQDLVLGAGR